MRAFTFFDLAFIGSLGEAPVLLVEDDFEGYTPADDLDGLNGGTEWGAAYTSRGEDFPPTDDFDSYSGSIGSDIGSFNGGQSWSEPYNSKYTPSPNDDFESYSDTADLDGLNDGVDWAAAYVSR